MSIFGTAGGTTLGSTAGNRHSLEFKAGRMNLVDSDKDGVKKKMMHPDNRKGLLYIYAADDGLTHFCWKDRTTGNVADDLIIFPDDCEFKKVDQCKDGRVFVLKFKSSNRKLFFWSQEPSTDKDDECCRKINELLNNPPSSSGGSGSGAREGSDVQYLLNNMSQQQLMQLFNGVGQMGDLSSLLGTINRTGTSSSNRTATATPSTRAAAASAAAASAVTTLANTTQPATPKAPKKEKSAEGSTSETTSDSSRVLLSELQNYLSGINTGASAPKHNIDLSTSINSATAIDSILSDPERLERLSAHLPVIDDEGKPLDVIAKKQQLKDTLASPQFQQALSMFSTALQTGQMGPVVSQFKLSDDAVSAAFSGNLEQFVKALEKTEAKETKDIADKDDEKNEESKN